MARKETFRNQCIRLNSRINNHPSAFALTSYEQKEAIRKLHPAHPIASKARAYCSHCGSQVSVLTQKECPVCHSKWGKVKSVERCSRHKAYEYLCVMTVMEGLQVLRFWYVGYFFRPGQKTDYDVVEVERQFINEKGERHGFAKSKPQNYFGRYDAWNWNSDITIKDLRPPRYYGYYGDTTTPRFDLPCVMTVIKQVIPMLHRNGLRTSLHGTWHPAGLCIGLLQNHNAETLWKQGQWAMAVYLLMNSFTQEDIMARVRICTRHHYRIKDARMWCDHIKTLRHLGLDTHNPHYICPKNLKKAHNEMNDRLRRRREKQERERRASNYASMLARMDKEKAAYVERMGRMLTISLSGKNLTVRPLQTIDEFAEEGVAMKHCVFENRYYKHPNTLILSAKDGNGNRLATIEYNTQRFSIEQCRAACNQVPKRDAEIRNLITSHQHDFEKMLKAA